MAKLSERIGAIFRSRSAAAGDPVHPVEVSPPEPVDPDESAEQATDALDPAERQALAEPLTSDVAPAADNGSPAATRLTRSQRDAAIGHIRDRQTHVADQIDQLRRRIDQLTDQVDDVADATAPLRGSATRMSEMLEQQADRLNAIKVQTHTNADTVNKVGVDLAELVKHVGEHVDQQQSQMQAIHEQAEQLTARLAAQARMQWVLMGIAALTLAAALAACVLAGM